MHCTMKFASVFFVSCLLMQARPVPLPKSESNETDDERVGPPDHINGVPLERDGDLNKEVDSEMFLGSRKEEIDDYQAKDQLEEIFDLADKDDDGLLSPSELKDWIHSNAIKHREESEEYNQDQFQGTDLNKDGFIDWNEYTKQIRDHIVAAVHIERDTGEYPSTRNGVPFPIENEIDMVYNSTIERDTHLWKLADANRDNRIEEQEFLVFQHPEHNKKSMRTVISDLIAQLDHDGNEKLDESEFMGYYQYRMLDFDENNKEALDRRRTDFYRYIDRNHDQLADQVELEEYLDPQNIQHAYNEAMYLLEQADDDEDKMLSLSEILSHSDLFVGSRISNMLSDSLGHVVHWEL